MSELIRREDAHDMMIKAWSKFMPMSFDIEGAFITAEINSIPAVDAIEIGAEYRTDAFDIAFITYKSEDGSEKLETFRIERVKEWATT